MENRVVLSCIGLNPKRFHLTVLPEESSIPWTACSILRFPVYKIRTLILPASHTPFIYPFCLCGEERLLLQGPAAESGSQMLFAPEQILPSLKEQPGHLTYIAGTSGIVCWL